MGVAIKGPDATIYIDPCLTNYVAEKNGDWWYRAYPPPIQPEEITNADYYFITHEHGDHFDPQTVAAVAKASPNVRFIAPGWCAQKFKEAGISEQQIIYPEALKTLTLPGTILRYTAIPAAHYTLDFDPEKGYRWLGYLIEWNGVTFYHAGDTLVYEGYIRTLQKLPKADIALLPINGRDHFREAERGVFGNLLPEEAARLATFLDWDVLLIGHNDLFPNNTIPFAHVVDALQTIVPRQKYKFLQAGELLHYIKE